MEKVESTHRNCIGSLKSAWNQISPPTRAGSACLMWKPGDCGPSRHH